MRYVHGILHPGMYHGWKKKPPFFEGWYFKVVDSSERHRFAFIPGVFLSEDETQQHAFVQVLDGNSGKSRFMRFPRSSFHPVDGRFEIRVADSLFSADRIVLDLGGGDDRISGELRFTGGKPWPVSLLSPGAMGWYAWVPYMECFHAVLSFDHRIEGALQFGGSLIDFTGGRGYMEKDWGRSFPSAHIWIQSNHFTHAGSSLMVSVAVIPWIRSSFRGFIAGLHHEGLLHRFATYTGARIRKLGIGKGHVHIVISDQHRELIINAERTGGGLLHSPSPTAMEHRLLESLTAIVEVEFTDRLTGFHWAGRGGSAGMELGGDVAKLEDGVQL